MRARGKRLSEADRAVWANYAAQVTLLAGRVAPELPPAVAAPTVAPTGPAVVLARPGRRAVAPVVVGQAPSGLDKASWRRLVSGRAGRRRLDLHGLTAQRAYEAFAAALLEAVRQRQRLLEVITGRGSGEGGGILRRELPLWINLPQFRPLVLAAVHPHAANEGAVWLLLRKG